LLIDVTLRDGGYVNGHTWTRGEAREVVRTMSEAGVAVTEVGYLRARHDHHKPSASCPADYLTDMVGSAGHTRIAVMVRPGEAPVSRVAELGRLAVTMLRVVVPGGRVDAAAPYLEAAARAGLRPVANLTRVSEVTPAETVTAVHRCAQAGAEIVYLADSNGSMFPEQVRDRVQAARSVDGVVVGFHPHDNLQLAFINACTALAVGAGAVDASLGGIGKGGGNLRIELLVAYWRARYGTDIRIDPLLGNRTAVADRLRMLVEPQAVPLLGGILDMNLDSIDELRDGIARSGCDRWLRERGPARSLTEA
jgi:4-hydroxy 2-oxovalerate aldolase